MRRLTGPALVAVAALTLAGCGGSENSGASEAGLSVASAYMPQPVSDSLAAGFLVIENKSDTEDELSSVTSDIAETVTVHRTVGQSMEEARNLEVPADGELVFESGGNHLMFENLKRKPKEGETVSVELHFAKSEAITVRMPVKSATYNPKTGH
ncbi:copper chaperone PCu(A)C [Streptomyces sp. NPDC002845]